MQNAFLLLVTFATAVPASWVMAQVPLFNTNNERQPLIEVRATPEVSEVVTGGGIGSLFIGRSGRSLLAPYPTRPRNTPSAATNIGQAIGQGTPQLVALRQLIADAEAGPLDYDAVQYGARIKPSKPPTQMTLAEINIWIDRTPGQPHAIGRYQFIPATLRRLIQIEGLAPDTLFTPEIQDRLADILLADAGLGEFTAGRLSQRQFMNNLAKIWAGLPNSTGRSHYHGYAGNKASISWSHFEREMQRIFSG